MLFDMTDAEFPSDANLLGLHRRLWYDALLFEEEDAL